MDYTKKIIGFSAAHCICVFSRYGFKCVFVFLLFCISLLTFDIIKTEAQSLAVHKDYNFKEQKWPAALAAAQVCFLRQTNKIQKNTNT